MIPYGRQDIGDAEIAAVTGILRSDWLTQGPTIEEFERAVADYCGARYAVAVSNGTASLHVACMALGIGPGDIVWTSPISFVASANCVRYCGADVDFVDIDPRTYNMDAAALKAKLESAKQKGRLPKAIIPVHFSGQPCDMAAIKTLAYDFGVHVIEDAAHAIGADYREKKIGSCAYSDMASFSFHPVKIVTTGEGGMVTTNDEELYRRLILMRSHGVTRDTNLMTQESEGGWFYEQIALGFNYRMTDIQAALGLVQLGRIDLFLDRRRQLALRYDQALASLPLVLPWQHKDGRSAYHLYVVKIDVAAARKTRRQVYDELRSAGVGVQVHYRPIHLQPYYRALGFRPRQFPLSEAFYDVALSLPIYTLLTDKEQDGVINILGKILS